jgi:energy-coupling factor transporter ATP-binding protein EcfA2
VSIATHHYNPDWLSDDALVAGFIARQAEFRFLRDELARAPLEGSVQHYLLIGLRGAGKTTLLKRLAVAIRRDADLADHLIALSFPEELYQVKDLADFWWAACEALVDELDRQGRRADADALMDRTDAARAAARRGDQPADAGLALLLDTCARLQRRPVMLVDNLDMVFERIDKRGRKLKDPTPPPTGRCAKPCPPPGRPSSSAARCASPSPSPTTTRPSTTSSSPSASAGSNSPKSAGCSNTSPTARAAPRSRHA